MPIRVRGIHLISALLLTGALVTPAAADDWDTCAKDSGDAAIAACTRAINSKRYTGRVLALAFNNRGVEWKSKGDLDRAIADYGAAVRLDADYAAAFTNRGLVYERKQDYPHARADFKAALAAAPQKYPNTRGAQHIARERLAALAKSAPE